MSSIPGYNALDPKHLSKVELRILLSSDTLNLYQRSVGAGVALSTLVAQNSAFAVQSVNPTEMLALSP